MTKDDASDETGVGQQGGDSNVKRPGARVYSLADARDRADSDGLKRDPRVVGALSYPDALARAWRNYGWPFWVDGE